MAVDEYVMRRRQYVAEIRRSFDTNDSKMEDTVFENTNENSSSILFLKVRFFIALCIFAAFMLCKYTGYTFYEYDTKEVVDIITDNQYYTKLQNYVKIEGQFFSEKEAVQKQESEEESSSVEAADHVLPERKD